MAVAAVMVAIVGEIGEVRMFSGMGVSLVISAGSSGSVSSDDGDGGADSGGDEYRGGGESSGLGRACSGSSRRLCRSNGVSSLRSSMSILRRSIYGCLS